MTLYGLMGSYGMKSGFAEKQFFKLRKIVFFAHAWTALQFTHNLYVERLGDMKHCFPQQLEEHLGFAEKHVFKLHFFPHMPRNIGRGIGKVARAV